MEILIKIVDYFLWFILYSVLGWILETCLFAIRDKKSVKRGFLFGPLCPIYGTGAVLCTLLLYGRVTNFFALFGAGLVLCTVIEYITHFVLEKVFHSMWWDYSNQKFNIKGRICLCSSLLFGAGVAVLMRFIQPFVESVTLKIPQNARLIAAFIIYSVLIVDLAITVQSLKDIINSLKEIQRFIIDETQEGINKADEKVDELVEHFKSIPSPDEIAERIKTNEHISKLVDRLENKNLNVRFISERFPRLRMPRYKEAADILFKRNSGESKSHEKNSPKDAQPEDKEDNK